MEIEKIFQNTEFINSREGRIVKIMAEYLETKTKLEKLNINNSVVIFGSARIKSPEKAQLLYNQALETNTVDIKHYKNMLDISKYYGMARELAYKIALWSAKIDNKNKFYLCSGGGGGIMEACNLGAHDAGEKSLGFNIILPFEQEANPYVDKEFLFSFHYFFIRKFWFSYLAKAFITFPGGFGTIDEFSENLTLIQTRKMKKAIPMVFIGKEFYSHLLNTETLEKYGLISEQDKNLFLITDDINEAFEYVIKGLDHWIT